jgi:hypothetical protein
MEITTVYQKERKEFGRPVNTFAPGEVTVYTELEFFQEPEILAQHIKRNPTILEIQAKAEMSEANVRPAPPHARPRASGQRSLARAALSPPPGSADDPPSASGLLRRRGSGAALCGRGHDDAVAPSESHRTGTSASARNAHAMRTVALPSPPPLHRDRGRPLALCKPCGCARAICASLWWP